MAIDQYGQTHHLGATKWPRKTLLEKFDRKHADKMYKDGADGLPIHIGYIIDGLWLTLFNVQPYEKTV